MSNKKYDIERLRDDIVSLMQANLNTKIANINAEKNDGIVIAEVPIESYINNREDEVINLSPVIFYGFLGSENQSNGNSTAQNATFNIYVAFDNRNQANTETKALRYTRCLSEVIQDNYKKIASASQLSVAQIIPADFKLNDGSDFKIGGINISATIFS